MLQYEIKYRKERVAMLKEKNQENIIIGFFVVLIVLVGMYVFIDRSAIDIIYLGVLGYYFCRFLVVRYRR